MDMKNVLLILSLLITSISFSQDTKLIANKVLQSTVSIVTKDNNYQTLALGSGFIIDNERIVTNVHVIEDAKYVYVIKNNSKDEIQSTGYIAIDKTNDLVILKVPSLIGQKLNINNINLPQIGEQIYVAGNPKGLSGTFSNGLVSGIRELESKDLIQISAPISPGSSGGPVVDKNAQLIGVSVGGVSGGQNLNFAIPVKYVKSLQTKISDIKHFNIVQSKGNNKEYDNIREGVIVQDITSSYQDWGDGLPKHLQSFSIRNNLSYPIKKVKLLFIVYNKQGIPTDSHEEIFCRYDPIKPHLAYRKKIRAWGYVENIKATENWEIRVLDFEIIK